jgi:hypothetical protein
LDISTGLFSSRPLAKIKTLIIQNTKYILIKYSLLLPLLVVVQKGTASGQKQCG